MTGAPLWQSLALVPSNEAAIWGGRPSALNSPVCLAWKSPRQQPTSIPQGLFPGQLIPLAASWSCLCDASLAAVWRPKTACLVWILSWLTANLTLGRLVAWFCLCLRFLLLLVDNTFHHQSGEILHPAVSRPSAMMCFLACFHWRLKHHQWCPLVGSHIMLLSLPPLPKGYPSHHSTMFSLTAEWISGSLPTPTWPPLSSIFSFTFTQLCIVFLWCCCSTTSLIRHKSWFSLLCCQEAADWILPPCGLQLHLVLCALCI